MLKKFKKINRSLVDYKLNLGNASVLSCISYF